MRARFQNADVLGPYGFSQNDLLVDGSFITDDIDAPVFDLSGFQILPGIVDLHGDGFERHLAPRRGAVMDMQDGLRATEAELAAHGITTAVLAQFFSWEGGMRGPEFGTRLVEAVSRFSGLLDLVVQIRLEMYLTEVYAQVEELIAKHDIRYLVFNDHLPHEALSRGRKPPRLTGQALKSGRSPEAHHALLIELAGRDVWPDLRALAARLEAQGVRLGSHDDPTPDSRARFRNLGVNVAEFPETRETAEAARSAGDPVLLGAPNVIRGGSHKGNVNATQMVADGLCDALVSDYHYPSLVGAVRRLVRDGVCDWGQAWKLVSSGPAEVLGLSDRGQLQSECRADFIVLEPETGRVCLTVAAGEIAHLSSPVADRLMQWA